MSEDLRELVEIIAARPCLRRKDLAQRYGCDVRTIDRWHSDGTLPPGTHFHGPVWSPAALLEAEKSAALRQKIDGAKLPEKPRTTKFSKALQTLFPYAAD